MPSILEQYRISDFLEWHDEKKLTLNPEFQRGSVWTPPARTFLIDTILRELPMPKVYLRTVVDIETKVSVREVVDGQQRLRTIIDFAHDRFALTKRAGEFAGFKYSTLSDEQKESFLSYPIAVHQLLNASDADVLEVFSRLNSYSVTLNDAERRHARFQGEFKWAVHRAAQHFDVLWDKYGIVSVRNRVRMLDDSLMSEMLGVLIQGVTDGGQPKINNLYRSVDARFDRDDPVLTSLYEVTDYFIDELADYLDGTDLLSGPHFLMLFAALAHAKVGIPQGELDEGLPARRRALADVEIAKENLLKLAAIIDLDDEPDQFADFWRASSSSTQRIASRRIRFPVYFDALLPEAI